MAQLSIEAGDEEAIRLAQLQADRENKSVTVWRVTKPHALLGAPGYWITSGEKYDEDSPHFLCTVKPAKEPRL